MNRMLVLGALLPALMTTAAMAADMVEPQVVVEDAPAFTLTGTIGVVGFQLPDFDTGVFGINDDSLLWGGMIGVSGSGTVGNAGGDWDVVLGVNAFAAFAGGSSSSTETFTGPGTVYITGLSTPTSGDEIALNAGANPVTANITHTNPAGGGSVTALSAATGANNNVTSVVPSGASNGFTLGAVTTNVGGTNDAAYGAIADSSGGIFVGTGDISGLSVTTDVSRKVIYTGADVTLGLSGSVGDGAAAEVYVGPSYRGLFQTNTTDVTVNIAESPGVVTIPEFKISTEDDIDSNYLGGVLGGKVSFAATDGVVFSLGLEGGVYAVSASWTGQDTYSTCCGDFAPAGVVVSTSPTLSVVSDELTSEFDSDIAFAVRGNAGVTWALDDNRAFTLGGSLEYLSKVAAVDHNNRTLVTGGNTADWDSGEAPVPGTTFSWGSMVNFALTASLTGQF